MDYFIRINPRDVGTVLSAPGGILWLGTWEGLNYGVFRSQYILMEYTKQVPPLTREQKSNLEATISNLKTPWGE